MGRNEIHGALKIRIRISGRRASESETRNGFLTRVVAHEFVPCEQLQERNSTFSYGIFRLVKSTGARMRNEETVTVGIKSDGP